MFHLGRRSSKELQGVHPDLVRVVKGAIKITGQDFSVHDGLRTEAEQREMVARGASRTMLSKHLKHSDGYGHAVDLVPYINGKLRWEWEPIYVICGAVRQVAEELGVDLRWGGCWSVLNGTTKDPKDLVLDYSRMRRREGKRVFIDGPHYELWV